MASWNNFFGNKREEESEEKIHPEIPAEESDGCDGAPVEVLTVTGNMPRAEKRDVVYEEKLVCDNTVLIHQTEKIIGEADRIIGETDKIKGETGRIIDALRKSINNQAAIYSLLQEQMQRQVEENQRLSEIIRKQHETISSFQKNVLYYSQKDVILEIIKIADEVETIREIGKNDGDLQEQVDGLSEFIDTGLTYSAVKSFRDADGISKEYNPKRQELSNERVVTHDPEKDGAIVSLRPGYIWRLPWLVANTDVQLDNFIKANKACQTYEVLIRPEKVARMKYEAPEETVATEEVAAENIEGTDDFGVNF